MNSNKNNTRQAKYKFVINIIKMLILPAVALTICIIYEKNSNLLPARVIEWRVIEWSTFAGVAVGALAYISSELILCSKEKLRPDTIIIIFMLALDSIINIPSGSLIPLPVTLTVVTLAISGLFILLAISGRHYNFPELVKLAGGKVGEGSWKSFGTPAFVGGIIIIAFLASGVIVTSGIILYGVIMDMFMNTIRDYFGLWSMILGIVLLAIGALCYFRAYILTSINAHCNKMTWKRS